MFDWARRLFRAEAGRPGPTDDYWYEPRGMLSLSGQRVSAESAMRVAAVATCVRILSETLASLPLVIYRRLPGGGREPAPDHPLYQLLHDRPNRWQTSFRWREMSQGHLALRGNSYSRIIADGAGRVQQLVPMHPDRVAVRQLEGGALIYEHSPAGAVLRQVLVADEVLHLRGLSDDGIMGLSPLAYAREAFGGGLALQDFGARFFLNDAKPGFVLKHPGHFKDDEALERFRKSVQDSQTGANRHKVMVLEDGMAPENIGSTNEDAQFLESRKFNREEIASLFGVPAHFVGGAPRAPLANREQEALDFVIHTVRPWAVRTEEDLERSLLGEDDTFFIEHNVDALLRGDLASRYAAYAVGINWGFLSPNDVRRRENLNPREGGDIYLQPVNMAPSGFMPGNPGQAPASMPPRDQDDTESRGPTKLEIVK